MKPTDSCFFRHWFEKVTVHHRLARTIKSGWVGVFYDLIRKLSNKSRSNAAVQDMAAARRNGQDIILHGAHEDRRWHRRKRQHMSLKVHGDPCRKKYDTKGMSQVERILSSIGEEEVVERVDALHSTFLLWASTDCSSMDQQRFSTTQTFFLGRLRFARRPSLRPHDPHQQHHADAEGWTG